MPVAFAAGTKNGGALHRSIPPKPGSLPGPGALSAAITGAETERKIQAIKDLARPGEVVVGAAELKAIIAGLTVKLATHVADAGKLLKREASVFNGVVTEQIRLWRSKVRNGCAPEAADQIQRVMGWRTSQVPRSKTALDLSIPRTPDRHPEFRRVRWHAVWHQGGSA
jgi:hypothetical protein